MEYILSTDTSCDAFKSDLDKSDIKWVPLTFTFKSETYDDNFDSDNEYQAFYNRLASGEMSTTSQINVFSHEEYFDKLLAQDAKPIVHLTLSGGLSDTVNSARLAAKNVMERNKGAQIHIIDTLSATQGHNLLLKEAMRLRDSGCDAKTAAAELQDFAGRIHHFFMVDDLHHLKRGGRISKASAFFGSILNIKPLLIINNQGKLAVVKKAKGWGGAIKYFLEMVAEHKADFESGEFLIVNANAHKYSNELKARLEELYPSCPVTVGWVGPVIGSHVGSGMFGVTFVGKKRLDDIDK